MPTSDYTTIFAIGALAFATGCVVGKSYRPARREGPSSGSMRAGDSLRRDMSGRAGTSDDDMLYSVADLVEAARRASSSPGASENAQTQQPELKRPPLPRRPSTDREPAGRSGGTTPLNNVDANPQSPAGAATVGANSLTNSSNPDPTDPLHTRLSALKMSMLASSLKSGGGDTNCNLMTPPNNEGLHFPSPSNGSVAEAMQAFSINYQPSISTVAGNTVTVVSPFHHAQRRPSGIYHSAEGGILSQTAFTNHALKKMPRWPIWRVCITGGPCSGKSTSMPRIKTELEACGFRVYIVPEVATLMINGGLEFSNMTREKRVNQQKVILQTIMMLEDSFYELAKGSMQPSIILCDRGTLDGSAYCSAEEFEEILGVTGYTIAELRDARYDAIVHLVTTAIGATDAYTTANNQARRENTQEAADLDRRTREKWNGHRLLGVFDNSTSFDEKCNRVVQFIKRIARIVEAGSATTPSRKPSAAQLKLMDAFKPLPPADELNSRINKEGSPLRPYRSASISTESSEQAELGPGSTLGGVHIKAKVARILEGGIPSSAVETEFLTLTLEPSEGFREEKLVRQKTAGGGVVESRRVDGAECNASTLYFYVAEREQIETLSNSMLERPGALSVLGESSVVGSSDLVEISPSTIFGATATPLMEGGQIVAGNIGHLQLTREEFESLRADGRRIKAEVRKRQYTFFYNEKYFTFVQYEYPEPKMVLVAPFDCAPEDYPSYFEYTV